MVAPRLEVSKPVFTPRDLQASPTLGSVRSVGCSSTQPGNLAFMNNWDSPLLPKQYITLVHNDVPLKTYYTDLIHWEQMDLGRK